MNQDPFGLDARPEITLKLVEPNRRQLVVLDRISDNPDPEYCVHGRTRCMECDQWCHLGPQTFQLVNSGAAMPFCVQCATPHVNDGRTQLIGQLDDQAGHR